MPPLVYALLMIYGIVCMGLGLVTGSSLWMGTPAKARAIVTTRCA